MKNINLLIIQLSIFLIIMIGISSCGQKTNDKVSDKKQPDISTIEREIDIQLREFEKHLLKGDSIALGNMYTVDAEIMPSIKGRKNIIKNFGGLIRGRITGSSFNTVNLWGNEQLVVEEGTGVWSHENGQIVERGKYLVVWKKENETWKIFRDIWFPEKKK